jgi:hypothetical protein
MALSREAKEALSDYYRNTDLYDPSKDPKQEVSTFEPKGMCGGGILESGFADGGPVLAGMDFGALDGLGDDFAGPSVSGDTETARGKAPEPDLAALVTKVIPPPEPPPPIQTPAAQTAPRMAAAAPQKAQPPSLPMPGSMPPQEAAPAAADPSGKLAPDQFDELIKALQPAVGQRLGQGAFSGLAGLADAIETGVARAGNPGFQKNIEERSQDQKTNLANALRAKYEAGYKGQELAQSGERLKQDAERIKNEAAHNKATEAQSAAMLKFDQDRERINSDLEAGKISLEEAKDQMEAAQKGAGLFNAIGRKLGYGPPLPTTPTPAGQKIPVVRTKEEYARLPKGTHYQDANGKQGIKK